MERSISKSRWLISVAAGLMVLAACGGDNSGGSSGTTAAPATTAGTSATSGTTSAPTTAEAKKAGWAGELKIATGESASMDPAKLKTDSSSEWERTAAVFDTLMRLDAESKVQPQLAQSLESTDGKVWTLKLRPNIKFTDGTTLDAEAVLFNIKRQQDPANAFGGAGVANSIESMRAVDPTTVEFILKSPNGTFSEGFAGINGMIGSPTALQADPEKPVGAGPYVLKEYVRDSHVVLERNPGYWNPEQPAYQTVRLQLIPDPLARAAALNAGEVEIAYSGGVAMLIQLGADIESKGFHVEHADGASMVLLNHSRGPTQDVRVREAISVAFDPARVNAVVLGGLWKSLELPCPPFSEDAPECVKGLWPKYNPDRAKSLIAEYKAAGNSVDLGLLGNPSNQNELEFIQQTLNGIGLNVTLNVVPPAEWLPKVNAGEFDIGWYASGQPVAPRLYSHFKSDQRNLIKANIPEYDAAVLKARTSLDPAERKAAWTTVQEIMAKQFLVAWYGPFIDGYVVKDGIDYGDQIRTVRMQISELAPS
jgi:ABC-type transport system substrate-binding protein